MRLSQDLAKSCLYQPYGTVKEENRQDKSSSKNAIKESASKRALHGEKKMSLKSGTFFRKPYSMVH